MELDGSLCKACVLFDKSEKNRGIFVKNVFQKVSKPEKIKEHETLAYHSTAMLKAKDFVNSYKDPTTNVDYDAEKEKRYENNLHVLKRVIQAVKVCAKQNLPLRGHRDNSTDEFSKDGNFIPILKSFVDIDTILHDHLENGPKIAQMK